MAVLPRLFLLLLALQSDALADDNVKVVENFLTSDESEAFLQQVQGKLLPSNPHLDRVQSNVFIDNGIYKRLVNSMAGLTNKDGPDGSCIAEKRHEDPSECSSGMNEAGRQVHVTSIVKPTSPHRDQVVDPTARVSNSRAFKSGFVFLDDNPDGYFLHGSTKIQAKKGAFVVFDSHVPHHTFVPSVTSGAKSHVHLLGPFTVTTDQRLTAVGKSCLLANYVKGLAPGDYVATDAFNDGTTCAITLTASYSSSKKCLWRKFFCRKSKGPYLGTSGKSARVLDSSNPTYDPDLGTPNESCSGGGPGIGDGGTVGTPNANCYAWGNVLIIQQSKKQDPNSWSKGGTYTVVFARLMFLDAVFLLGLGANETATINAKRSLSSGDTTTTRTVEGVGANALYSVSTALSNVTEVTIAASSSFAFVDMRYYP